jgi:pimeloyl-ACP methyl ester carboxylesterase
MGAIVGLDLATRFPEAVAMLVAHEPPLVSMLPEASRLRADDDTIQCTLERDGPDAAVMRLMQARGILPHSRFKRAAMRSPCSGAPARR